MYWCWTIGISMKSTCLQQYMCIHYIFTVENKYLKWYRSKCDLDLANMCSACYLDWHFTKSHLTENKRLLIITCKIHDCNSLYFDLCPFSVTLTLKQSVCRLIVVYISAKCLWNTLRGSRVTKQTKNFLNVDFDL